jgi:hypothetical protein
MREDSRAVDEHPVSLAPGSSNWHLGAWALGYHGPQSSGVVDRCDRRESGHSNPAASVLELL